MHGKLFAAWFAFCALLSVGSLAFVGWAIYTLVMWTVTK